MTRRQKVLVAAVAVVLVLMYGGAAATAGGSGTGDVGARPGGMVGWLGGLVGRPPAAARSALSAPCLKERTLTVSGSCVLSVAEGRRTRRVALHAEDAVDVTARPPGEQEPATIRVDAGRDVDVTVGRAGGDITLTCSCTVTLT